MSEGLCWLDFPSRDLECPPLCVKAQENGIDIDWTHVQADCPEKCQETLWPDGTCTTVATKCGDPSSLVRIKGLNHCKTLSDPLEYLPIQNVCECANSALATFQVCMGDPLVVHPEHWTSLWEVAPPKNQTLNSCTRLLQSQTERSISSPSGKLVVSGDGSVESGFLQCPLRTIQAPLTANWEKRIYIGVMVVCLAIVVLHGLRRCWRNRKQKFQSRETPNGFHNLENEFDKEEAVAALGQNLDPTGIRLEGYKTSKFGLLGFLALNVFALMHLLSLAIQVMDAYGLFGMLYCNEATMRCREMDAADFHWRLGWQCGAHCLFTDAPITPHSVYYPHDNLADGDRFYLVFFLISWLITSYVLLSLLGFRSSIRRFFRHRCSLNEAEIVQVEQRKDPPFLVEAKGSGMMSSLTHFFTTRKLRHQSTTRCRKVKTNATQDVRYFDHYSERYTLNLETLKFEKSKMRNDMNLRDLAQRGSEMKGLSDSVRARRLALVGPNAVHIPTPSLARSIFKEIASPYTVYQIMCMFVWVVFYYWLAACFVVLAAAAASILRARSVRASVRRISKLARIDDNVHIVDESGQTKTIQASQLVVGDLVRVLPNQTVPADLAVVLGNCLVNESSLTGEPNAIAKEPVESGSLETVDFAKHQNCILMSGTRIVTASPGTYGVVLAVGIDTERGRLLNKALNPSKVVFHFEEEWNVVFVMLLIWSSANVLLGVALVNWQIEGWFYGVFTMSQILSPMIPAVFVAGQAFPARALRKKGVHCANLQRVQVAGRVNHVCFDKTGTLTEASMKLSSVIHWENNNLVPATGLEDLRRHEDLLWSLRCCHDLHLSGNQLAPGADVDEALFQFARGALETHEGVLLAKGQGEGTQAWKILKRFPFNRLFLSSAVLCQPLLGAQAGVVKYFVKGAVEAVERMCFWPDPVVRNLVLAKAIEYSHQGLYVIMLASLDLPMMESIESLRREQMSQNMHFIGLLVFQNPILSTSGETIAELKAGGCAVTMLTGDSLPTAVAVARETGILSQPVVNLDDHFARDHDINPEVKTEIARRLKAREVQVVMSGVSLRFLTNRYAWEEIRDIVMGCRVFARVSADQKCELVRTFMTRDVTAMVGDGANDARALEVAHCGIAVGTDTETATNREAGSVAHICCETRDTSRVVTTLREGRASLASTTTAYRFLIIYGEIMVMLSAIEMYLHIVPGEMYFIFVDVVINCSMVWAIFQTRPTSRLHPQRPGSHLLTKDVVVSTTFQIFSHWVFMVVGIALLTQADWFKCKAYNKLDVDHAAWWKKGDNYEAAVLGLIATWQWACAGPLINLGGHFRKLWLKNWKVNLIAIGCLTGTGFILFTTGTEWSCLFRTNCGDASLLRAWNAQGNWNGIVSSAPSDRSWSAIPPGCPCESQVGISTTCENEYSELCNQPFFNQRYHHNILPMDFRYLLLGLAVGNFIWNGCLETIFNNFITPRFWTQK